MSLRNSLTHEMPVYGTKRSGNWLKAETIVIVFRDVVDMADPSENTNGFPYSSDMLTQ